MKAGSDWRKSNLVYVISGLETALFDIANCIKSHLKCIDEMSLVVTVLKGSNHLFCQHQSNYLHLRETNQTGNTRLFRQRTDAWYRVRSMAKVTSSTLNDAIGLVS